MDQKFLLCDLRPRLDNNNVQFFNTDMERIRRWAGGDTTPIISPIPNPIQSNGNTFDIYFSRYTIYPTEFQSTSIYINLKDLVTSDRFVSGLMGSGKFVVFKLSGISGEFTVKLPLIDTVYLKDKTARQAEEHIRDLYGREYLAKPQVNLFVLEYAPRRVFLAGAVATPGVVLFLQEQGLTLIDAISRAGSFNRLADKKRVTLKRTKSDGSTETFTINVEELMKGDSNLTWPLQPNDVINVPEKIL